MSLPTIKDFSATVTTSNLPARAVESIRAAAIEQMLEIRNLRQYGLTMPMDPGVDTYVYFKFDALTAAYDRVNNVDYSYDEAGATQGTATVVEIAKGFEIAWNANVLKKLGVRVAQTKAAVDKVKDREDTKIVAALTASSALTSTVTATAVLSGASADPVKDIAQAKRKIRVLTGGKDPDVMLIEEVNLEELESIVASNEWYGTVEKVIEDGQLVKFMGMKVISLPASKMAHGTAIFMCTGNISPFEVGVDHDIKLHIFDDNDKHTTKVQVFERICPVVVRADAGAKLTGW